MPYAGNSFILSPGVLVVCECVWNVPRQPPCTPKHTHTTQLQQHGDIHKLKLSQRVSSKAKRLKCQWSFFGLAFGLAKSRTANKTFCPKRKPSLPTTITTLREII